MKRYPAQPRHEGGDERDEQTWSCLNEVTGQT